MVIAVRTEESDGGLVVVKEARSDGDITRLSHEASMLARSRHPGVVDLLEVGERSIRLRHAGTALARLGPFPLDHAAGIVCAVADVVDALHRTGVVHGDLDADHVLLDERGRPRLCGFGQARDRNDAGAAEDVAALGRLLAGLLRAGDDLAWAEPPGGLRRSKIQRQARRDLDAIAAQATRAVREQRPTARQLAKAVHAAVPGCSLPRPGHAAERPPAAFAEIPADVDPTADLGWTAEDLSWLAAGGDDDIDARDDEASPDPYAALGGLHHLPDDGPDDWADLVARPELVTGPVPAIGDDDTDEPPVRATIAHEAQPERVALPSVALPPSREHEERSRQRWPVALRVALLALVLLIGVVGGVAGARALRPLGGESPAATGDVTSTTAPEPVAEASPATTGSPEETGEAGPDPDRWPATCEVPEPTGPDVDGDGCPEAIELDGRTATVGTVTVSLGEEGDLVVLGDWDCDGIDTPALLRPDTGEVFAFPEWRFDEPLEVEAVDVVPDASAIVAGEGDCPSIVLSTPDGARTVEVPA